MLFDYDDTDLNSVLNYAKKMENSTFRDILNLCKEYILEADNGNKRNRSEQFINSLKNDKLLTLNNAKGQLGNFIEKFYFGYEPNSNQNADLDKQIEDALATVDRDERFAKYADIQNRIVDEFYPGAFLVNLADRVAYQSSYLEWPAVQPVDGELATNLMGYHYYFPDMRLHLDKK